MVPPGLCDPSRDPRHEPALARTRANAGRSAKRRAAGVSAGAALPLLLTDRSHAARDSYRSKAITPLVRLRVTALDEQREPKPHSRGRSLSARSGHPTPRRAVEAQIGLTQPLVLGLPSFGLCGSRCRARSGMPHGRGGHYRTANGAGTATSVCRSVRSRSRRGRGEGSVSTPRARSATSGRRRGHRPSHGFSPSPPPVAEAPFGPVL